MNDKEKQIIAMIQEGRANKEIAAALGTTELSIKDKVHKLLRKHKCKNRTELAVKFAHMATTL